LNKAKSPCTQKKSKQAKIAFFRRFAARFKRTRKEEKKNVRKEMSDAKENGQRMKLRKHEKSENGKRRRKEKSSSLKCIREH
jgi:hypothetical protein